MTKLRKFHEKLQLIQFSVRLGLRNIWRLLDLENFEVNLDLDLF